MLYDRILVAVDPGPSEDDFQLPRIQQLAQMTGATVYLLHVARGHISPVDIAAGAGLGVLSEEEDDIDDHDDAIIVQDAVNELSAAGIPIHGELVSATEHDVAEVILRRASELEVNLIILGPQHQRSAGVLGHSVAEKVMRGRPQCSILLTRPPGSPGTSGGRAVSRRHVAST
jgi:nucleotide-binding universal stress UspA family protein